jgi:hypothetical protein
VSQYRVSVHVDVVVDDEGLSETERRVKAAALASENFIGEIHEAKVGVTGADGKTTWLVLTDVDIFGQGERNAKS